MNDQNVPLISVQDLSKQYGGVHALSGVHLTIRSGVVHGLVGANGAGKSTLIRCLAGIELPDSGSITIDGGEVSISQPAVATAAGMSFIHQEMSIIPGWSVIRNMTLGQRPSTRLGVIDWRPARARASAVAEQLGMTFGLQVDVSTLSTADQWLVLIGRALMQDARMIAMDEPTASLSHSEAERVHEIIRGLTAAGTAVLFVSHRLDEVSELCDDVTVFKDGKVVLSVVDQHLTRAELIRAIVGRDLDIPQRAANGSEGAVVLDVEALSDAKLLRDISLQVRSGEIVGLGGLVGAGRTELAKVIYGDRPRRSGIVRLDGAEVTFREPAEAVAAGIGFVPEERRSEGLFLERSIDFNINVAKLPSMRVAPWWPFLRMGLGSRRAKKVAADVTVKMNRIADPVSSLSGGNQQKVVIARWLLDTPRLLILDEPSRGVDVGARSEVYKVIRKLASGGPGVLVVSSDNEELVALCDRVLVMCEGRIAGELDASELSEDRILSLSFPNTTDKATRA